MSRKKELLLDDQSRADLGKCLRELRQMAIPSLSQREAASALKVSPSTLCQVEKGKAEPSLQLIRNAARLYKVHPNTILGVIYMQEFYMSELDPKGYLLAEAAGAVQIQHALLPEQRRAARERLRRMGYEWIRNLNE